MTRNLLLASAGAGKSMRIAEAALERAQHGGKVLLLAYTVNNQLELIRHICRINKYQPGNVVVKGWFSFLLEDMVRPYQQCIVPGRILGVDFNTANPHLGKGIGGKPFNYAGRAEKVDGRWNPFHYVTNIGNRAYTYYLAKLAATINEQTGGKPAGRLAEIYGSIFIDEVQDLVGWDYAILHSLVRTSITEIRCVGDFRQTIYQTSETTKKPQTSAEKLGAFSEMGFEVQTLAISWRCIQSICDLADRLHAKDGHYALTESQVFTVPLEYADHHGVFAVSAAHVDDYVKTYSPVILRWNRATQRELCEGRVAYNFGESKGLGFERVLIIPPDKHAKFLCGDMSSFDGSATDDSRNKLYVGITRARYSVAFLHKGGSVVDVAQVWTPQS